MYIVNKKIVGISKAKKATKIPGHLFSSKLRRTSECLKIKDFNPAAFWQLFKSWKMNEANPETWELERRIKF